MENVDDAASLRLGTADLTSKWGFADGDLFTDEPRVQALLRDVEQATGRTVGGRELLVAVVGELVLARLDQHVELADLGTGHNPARAAGVDGVPLDLYGNPPDGREPVEITPDVVEVTLPQIREVAMRLAARPL